MQPIRDPLAYSPVSVSRSVCGVLTAVVIGLTGCGASEVTRLETEQRALETEVATLRETVAELRSEMQRKGVLKSGPVGPRPKAAGAVAPSVVLTDEYPLATSRTATDLVLQTVSEPEPRSDTPCGWRVGVQHLEPISDFALAADGLGRSSPVLAQHSGRFLEGHAPPMKFEKTCSGAYRHQSKFLFYSPPAGAAEPGAIALQLAEEMPFADEGGRPRYWVYPGTTMTISASVPWDAAWGEPYVVFDLRLRDVGLASKPAARSEGTVVMTIGDREISSREAVWRASEPLGDTGSATITIHSPADGPFVLVDSLAIGNAGHAAVVTSKQIDGAL